jgi:uncharacterized ubiquitin-like protein YukD
MKAIDLAIVKAMINAALSRIAKVEPEAVDYLKIKSMIPKAAPAAVVNYKFIQSMIPPAAKAELVDYNKIRTMIPPAAEAKEVKIDYDLIKSWIPPAAKAEVATVDYNLVKSMIPKALPAEKVDYSQVKEFIKTNTPAAIQGDSGRGIADVRVNEDNMLCVTYTDGDLTIAGKMHFTKEASTASTYTGAPIGSFGVVGTKVNEDNQLVIVGPWGKQFNTGVKKSTSGIASLDFGSGSNFTEAVITGIPDVKASSVILIELRIEATEDHSISDLLYDPIRVVVKSLQPEIGFTIFAKMENSEAFGKYKVNWILV